jgi:hypothetical protein
VVGGGNEFTEGCHTYTRTSCAGYPTSQQLQVQTAIFIWA